ncbi:receptor like protein 21-like [Aphidius gifuensis]|uniref:receptor like protein 21-like n=1 Tax=Aphidius gifuensis TaxID=684658 RepID=UPI001CDCC38E|nr:receptor like protein 21-like [Aphidius gifuensis]
MRPKRKCVAKNQQISDGGNNNKKRSKRRCVVKDQQISDDGDKNKQKIVINSLDYDSLAKIIMLLPIPERIDMEEVCTKWKEASQLAWYDIKKYKCESSIGRCYDNRLLTQSYLEKILLRCGKYLHELSLSNIFDSRIMPFVGDHCKNLTTLECKFDDNVLIDNADHFVQAFTQLDKLKCIKILLNYTTEKKVINLFEIINSLPEEINEIHIFNECWFDYGNQEVLFTLKKFKNLQKLTSRSLYLDELTLQEIAEATTLAHLDIELHEKHVEFPLLDKLVNLEYIQIGIEGENEDKKDCTNVLNTFFCKCKNLKHLDIPNDFYNLAKIPLAKWKNLKNLEYLSLSCHDVSPDLVDTIVKYCKNLKHLCISSLPDIIEAYVVKKLTELENLEILEIIYESLDEEEIIAISNNCKKLKRLKLDGCTVISTDIDDDGLSSPSVFNELSKLQYLEHLSLEDAENIDDNTIIAIANNCKNLKSLDISGNSDDISETALVALTKLENLEILSVSSRNISDSFIIRLKGLKEFNCGHCRNLTDTGIIQFIKNNPDLEDIHAVGIDNITIDLVIGADQATKNRTNGIILRLRISNKSIIEASKSIIKSQWLVVTDYRG